MAIKEVTATLAEETTNLESKQDSIYSGNLTAPKENGIYSVQVSAYDDAGNVTTDNTEVEVTLWHTPKTNWKPTDRFNFVDYNRIKNNLTWLHEKAQELWKPFNIEYMGEDLKEPEPFEPAPPWKVRFFNAWEENLDTINKNIFTQDYGERQIFFENGAFIQWNELNRIESAILEMRDILDRQEAGLRKLSFRLGTFKGVKI